MPKGVQKLPGPWSKHRHSNVGLATNAIGIPLIGRVHDVPAEKTWLHFYKWAQKFGPIYKHEMFGTTHVWMSTEEVAKDLLARQGSIFSDRPMIHNLPFNKTGGEYLPLLGENGTCSIIHCNPQNLTHDFYLEIWVRQRKFGTHLMTGGARNEQFHYPVIETKRLLFILLSSPASYRSLLEDHSSRNISRLAWGSPDGAPALQKVTMALLRVISPSGALPNVVSPLASLPAQISPWKRYEKERYKEERSFFMSQLTRVRKEWLAGKAKPCYMRMFFETQQKSHVDDLEGAYQVGMMAIAGALTIASPLMSFVLAMVVFPSWLQKLQGELDAVCEDRLPEMKDMEKLPLLRAVVKEVVRWRPPVPTGVCHRSLLPASADRKLGIPHASTKDCVYKGYFIPAGSTIHAMEW